jgi:hypothetical protein
VWRAWPVALARITLVGVVILGTAANASAQTGPASSGSGDPTVTALRQQADAASGAYFAALSRYQAVSAQINTLEAQLPQLRDQTAALLRDAQGRAVTAYENAGSAQLGVLITSGDAMTAARRAQWLSALNARDSHALTDLKRTADRLRSEERDLRTAQATQASSLQSLDAQGRDIDAKLNAAVSRERQLAAAAAATAATPAASTATPNGSGSAPSGSAAAPAAPPPNYQPSPGENPHHNDPFLTCVRAHEGSYTSVNPAGPYMGAYQFLQSTWDSAANHAGRTNLIGVPPNQASPYDQDDVAWALYQWQGKGPWAGDPC